MVRTRDVCPGRRRFDVVRSSAMLRILSIVEFRRSLLCSSIRLYIYIFVFIVGFLVDSPVADFCRFGRRKLAGRNVGVESFCRSSSGRSLISNLWIRRPSRWSGRHLFVVVVLRPPPPPPPPSSSSPSSSSRSSSPSQRRSAKSVRVCLPASACV